MGLLGAWWFSSDIFKTNWARAPVSEMQKRRSALLWDAPPFSLCTGPLSGPGQRRCLLRWYYDPVAADRHDTEIIATVLLPAGFVVLGANRALLAIAHEVEAICRNAVVNEVPLGTCRTALA